MTGNIDQLEENSNSAADSHGPVSARSQTGEIIQVHSLHTEKIRIYRDQVEELPADDNTPLYNSRIINTYIEYLEKFYPDIEIDAVLQDSEMTRYEVEDPGHWFTQHQADRLHRTIVTRTGNPKIAREAGRYTVSSTRLGAAKQYALGSIGLASIYLKTGKLAQAMSRGAAIKSKKLGSNKVEIVSHPTPGTREKPYQCQNRIGTLEGVGQAGHQKICRA